MFVLDQCDADEAFAFLAEASSRGDRDLGMGQQLLGEFEAAKVGERGRQWRPGEHARTRQRNIPTSAGKAFDQHVAAATIQLAVFGDALLRAVERCDRRRLDRGERPVVEVRLDPCERRDQLAIADGKADPPPGHRIGLAHAGELDRDLLRARHLQDRRRRRAVEVDLGVGEIADHPDLVGFGKGDDLFVEGKIDRLSGRV